MRQSRRVLCGSMRNLRVCILPGILLSAAIVQSQTPAQLARFAKIVGGFGQQDEPGWSQTSNSLSGFAFTVYEKGPISVEFYADGLFRSCKNMDRRTLAANAAEQDSSVLIQSEEQAYHRAEQVLKANALWRATAIRDGCTLGPTARSHAEISQLLDGLADVYFCDTFNGIRAANSGFHVTFDRFSGNVIGVSVDRVLNYPTLPVTMTEPSAETLALSFVQSTSELTADEKSSFSTEMALSGNNGKLVYETDTVGSRWDAVPVFQFVGGGVGIQVNTTNSQCSVNFTSRSAEPTSAKSRTLAKNGDSKTKAWPFVAFGVLGIVAVGMYFSARTRKKP